MSSKSIINTGFVVGRNIYYRYCQILVICQNIYHMCCQTLAIGYNIYYMLWNTCYRPQYTPRLNTPVVRAMIFATYIVKTKLYFDGLSQTQKWALNQWHMAWSFDDVDELKQKIMVIRWFITHTTNTQPPIYAVVVYLMANECVKFYSLPEPSALGFYKPCHCWLLHWRK